MTDKKMKHLQEHAMPPTVRLQRTLLTFLWILSAMVSVPVMYLWQIESPERLSLNNGDIKTCEPVSDNTYMILSTMVSFFLPLLLTISFYIQIVLLIRSRWTLLKRRTVVEFSSILTSMMMTGVDGIELRRRAMEREKHSLGNGVLELAAPSISKAVHQGVNMDNNKPKPEPLKTNAKITTIARTMNYLKHIRMLIRVMKSKTKPEFNFIHIYFFQAMSIVVLMYICCWLPLYTTLLVKAICRCVDIHTWERFVVIFTWIGYANSGLNPIIYFLTLDEYRVLSISLCRLIGEKIRGFPKATFRTFWWLFDRRIRRRVSWSEFLDTARPEEVKTWPAVIVAEKPKIVVSNKSRNAARRSNDSNDADDFLFPNALRKSQSEQAIGNKHSHKRHTKTNLVNKVQSKSHDAIYNEISDDGLSLCSSEHKLIRTRQFVSSQRIFHIPGYYDKWGRPINYNAVEATI